MLRRTLVIVAMLAGVAFSVARADVKPNPLIADGMVLQQGRKVPIWGTADDGEHVTVDFRGREAQTVAKEGRWSVQLESGAAGGPFTLSIEGRNKLTLKDVLVGEVWVCSGQSNMWWPFSPRPNAALLAGTENRAIRLFTVPPLMADQPQREVSEAHWLECGPDTLGPFSAVGYHFGLELQRALKVPVGLIHASYGGSPAGQWTSTRAPAGRAELKDDLERHQKLVAEAAPFKAEIDTYQAELARAKREGKPLPPRPRVTAPGPAPGSLYNGMIAPLQPFAIRGVIWYQGEANTSNPARYRTLFPALIRSWREDWEQGDFPFLFVQIAPYGKIVHEPQESAWAELREAQLLTSMTVPQTAMAVATDLGHETQIHPQPKQPVGRRLALLARAVVYGEQIVDSGPLYTGMTIEGNKAVLSFAHVGTGLVAKTMVLVDVRKDGRSGLTGGALRVKDDGPAAAGVKLEGFAVCGSDRRFVNAEAEIRGEQVLVGSPAVPHPIAVRYGWADYPTGNLFNREGLPASPFRTECPPGATAK